MGLDGSTLARVANLGQAELQLLLQLLQLAGVAAVGALVVLRCNVLHGRQAVHNLLHSLLLAVQGGLQTVCGVKWGVVRWCCLARCLAKGET
jgi:hypothetical protein